MVERTVVDELREARCRLQRRSPLMSRRWTGCSTTGSFSLSDRLARTVFAEESTGVTWFLGSPEGAFSGAEFAARMRCTRTWIRHHDHGRRVAAAHAGTA